MNFIVTMGIFVLSFVVGIITYIILLEKQQSDNHEIQSGKKRNIVTIWHLATHFDAKSYIVLIVTSVFCAISSYMILDNNADVVVVCKELIVLLLLEVVAFCDLKTHRIPNMIVLTFLVISCVNLCIKGIMCADGFSKELLSCVVGFLGLFVMFYVMARLTKDGVGMGDVKLLAALGAVLGLKESLSIILLSLILCTLVAIFLLVFKKKSKNYLLPFGPFVFGGYVLALLLLNM